MAITPVNIGVTVTTAGTRVQVSTNTHLRPSAIYFEALATNTGYIYIGAVDVTSVIYMTRLAIGTGTWSIATGAPGVGIQLSSFYVDSSVSGEKVRITYVYDTGP
jgi:hypothetical protein